MEDGRIEIDKITDKLFVFVENRDQERNKMRNLMVNPEMLRIFLDQMTKYKS